MTFTLVHALLMLVLTALSWAFSEPRIAAIGGALSLVAFAWRGRPEWRAHGSFGLANSVTTMRIALVLLLGCVRDVGPASACCVVATFCLDGLDGWLARRKHTETAFGATYDMESDALLVLVAGLKLGVAGRLGPWIVVPGLLRYLYAATVSLVPAQGEAPRSRFARYVFAVMVASFVVSLWPLHPLHAVFAAAATILLVVSFARSAWWHFGGRVRRLA